jgi:hypothetical protein
MWSGVEVKDKEGNKYITDVEEFKSFLNSKFGKPRQFHKEGG